jgi:hypothetical protein
VWHGVNRHWISRFPTWSLSPWETFLFNAPIRLSPPYTASPGTSFTNSSLPPAWSLSLKTKSQTFKLKIYYTNDITNQWWWVVRTVVNFTFSWFTISTTLLGFTGSTIAASFELSSTNYSLSMKCILHVISRIQKVCIPNTCSYLAKLEWYGLSSLSQYKFWAGCDFLNQGLSKQKLQRIIFKKMFNLLTK